MPKLIKDNAVIDDAWQVIAKDDDIEPGESNQFIHLAHWLSLGDDTGSSAPWVAPDDDIEPCLDTLLTAPVIAIEFPTFMDGRGFSTAEILRRAGFKGELRAIGNLIQDQLFFLKRCGFDTVQLREGTDLDNALVSLKDFSLSYQTSADTPSPLFRRR
jgi:uncharacterized protein (DUF934 family)